MNLNPVEALLVRNLQQTLKKQADVHIGFPTGKSLAWAMPEVFVRASSFDDLSETDNPDNGIARRAVEFKKSFKGFVEERPSRIAVNIDCISSSYQHTQKLCENVLAASMPVLQALPHILLSANPGQSVKLVFKDFNCSLNSYLLDVLEIEESIHYCGRLKFNMDGFLEVYLTKRGGFKRKLKLLYRAKR